MNTNSSKKHKHHHISLSFPSCFLFSCLCFTTILQVKGSGFKKDERHSCFFGLSMSLNFHHINDTMQYPAEVDFEPGACINTKSFIKETFTRLEREVTVPLAIQKVTLYAYTLTVQNKHGTDLSTCNWLVFPSHSLQIHIIWLNI